jgi:hypothetical protein
VGLLQAVDQAAIRQAVEPRAGVDARDPETAQVAAAVAAVAVGIPQRMQHRLVGALEQAVVSTALALAVLEHFFVTQMGAGSALYTSHSVTPANYLRPIQ